MVTSLRELLKQQRDIVRAVDLAIAHLTQASPHPRDYPSPGDWKVARWQHRDELERLSSVRNAAYDRAQKILAQGVDE